MRTEVVEAKAHHVGYVIHRLRTEHRAYMDGLGLNSHRALREIFQQSAWRRTWLVDGKPAAVGGVSGSLLCSAGVIWLALTQAATKMPVAVMREARRQIAVIMETHSEIQSAMVLCDPAAWRFAAALGFCVKTPDGSRTMILQSHKTSPEDILRAAPEFRMCLPGYQETMLVSYQRGRA